MKIYKACFILLFLFLISFELGAAPRKDLPGVQRAMFAFTDSTGRKVDLPKPLLRIAPSGITAQMYLTAIAPDLFCAISAPYGKEVEFLPLAPLPVIGQFYGQSTYNPEEVARINPDIIIDVGETKATIAKDMDNITAATGVPVVHITSDLRGAPEAFRALGRLLDRQEKGEELALFCERALALAERVMSRVGTGKKSILYCMGKTGLNVLARNSYHSQILDWMTDNLAAVDIPSSLATGNESSLEQLYLWNPEVIFFSPSGVYDAVKNDPVWKEFKAVRNGAYYEVPEGPYNWMGTPPSINRYLGMLWMGAVLYPQYSDYDLYSEVKEYYRLFYGYDLSRERFNRLLARSL
ncbi:MAG: ABC transporter substrate-binding protein [Treponema sp.]|jgi:iron complex transport system substrate-binding protein|nr:ABC transporter substrate-binding protein [Treponema sp.]